MRFPSRGAVVLAFLLACGAVHGQSAAFFPLENVQPGQKGYARTVFEGSKIEEFGVEILGVLKNVGPKQDMILARLSGERLAEAGVFAGMSGSPVYVDGKLLGAIAYAFPFSKEPIAGITPIQQIVDIFKERPASAPRSGSGPVAWRRGAAVNPAKMLSAPGELAALAPGSLGVVNSSDWTAALRPIATPLNLSGFSPIAVEEFANQFRALGLEPVRGVGGMAAAPSTDTTLEAGSTIAVQLVRGDMDVSAVGTVTNVSGNRIYAFGHPFLSIGYTDLPLSKASVIAIIPSLMSSMKVAATTQEIGTIRQDRATGVMGVTGEKPRMIPVCLKLRTSRNEVKEFNYDVVTDTFLTPFLMAFTVQNGIVSSERAIGGQTLQLKCSIAVKGEPEVIFENSVSGLSSSSALAAVAASAPVQFLLNSGFDNTVLEKITIEIEAVEQTREAVIEKVWQDKVEARPGEEVNLTIFLRKPNGEIVAEKYPVKIPDDVPPGPLKVVVGDGLSLEKADQEADLDEFVPTNLRQLVRAINNLKKNDRLYIRLYRDQPGAIIEGEPLPDLPPSFLALYRSQKTSGEVKTINKVVYAEHELPPTEFVLDGLKVVKIKIKS
jgi:hypothetical protein